jgi:hypothetical protein
MYIRSRAEILLPLSLTVFPFIPKQALNLSVPWGVTSNKAHYVHFYVLLFKNPLVLLPVSAAFLSEVCPGFGQRRQTESEVLLKHLILTTKIVL